MSDVNETDTQVATGAPTARVADSYGFDPHEHKPSQDGWDADTAGEKQAETGGVVLSDEDRDELEKARQDRLAAEAEGGDDVSPGTSSSTSTNNSNSSDETNPSDSGKRAPTAGSRSTRDRKGNSSVSSTGTDRSLTE